MEELSDGIKEAIKDEAFEGTDKILDSVSAKWATHSLVTYKDRLLKKALAISEALSNFVAELEGRE